MARRSAACALLVCVLALGCGGGSSDPATPGSPASGGGSEPSPGAVPAGMVVYSLGQEEWVERPVTGGLMLQGGGTDNDHAFRWLIGRSGGGDAVVLRTDASSGYNPYLLNDLGGVDSVHTLVVNQRSFADSAYVETVIRNAELVFIAGGDQSEYYALWKGTRLAAALQYALTTKKVPVGGTSAGMAVLAGLAYIPTGAGVASAEALADPYHPNMEALRTDFVHAPFLEGLVTDTHWSERGRLGRTLAFLARAATDGLAPGRPVRGIAADTCAAVCMDGAGVARVFGSSRFQDWVTFFQVDAPPTRCTRGSSLHWPSGVRAVQVRGFEDGRNTFDLATWTGAGAVPVAVGVVEGVVTPDLQTPD